MSLRLLLFTCPCGWSGQTYARPDTRERRCPACHEQTAKVTPAKLEGTRLVPDPKITADSSLARQVKAAGKRVAAWPRWMRRLALPPDAHNGNPRAIHPLTGDAEFTHHGKPVYRDLESDEWYVPDDDPPRK